MHLNAKLTIGRVHSFLKSGIQVLSLIWSQFGIVEDITLRHTVVRDLDNNRIIIPNSILGNEVITNAHLGDKKVCRKIDIGIDYQADVDQAFGIIKEEVLKHPLHVLPEPHPSAVAHDQDVFTQIQSLAESAIVLRVWAWASNEDDAIRMEGELLKSIKSRFDEQGIGIPYPQRVVTFRNVTN